MPAGTDRAVCKDNANKKTLCGFAWEHFESIDSTNNYAKALARQGFSRVAVTADGQTGGRGRNGRVFCSEKGAGLYLSVVLPAEECDLLTIRAAVAVAEAIEELTGADAGIKWVNDIFVGGKKVCGILAEGVGGKAVLGIGVNLKKQEFPEELQYIAGDLETLTGVIVPPEVMAEAILSRLESPKAPLEAYRKRCFVLGKEVTVFRGEEIFGATALRILDDGGLVVLRSGKEETLRSGEVSVRV